MCKGVKENQENVTASHQGALINAMKALPPIETRTRTTRLRCLI